METWERLGQLSERGKGEGLPQNVHTRVAQTLLNASDLEGSLHRASLEQGVRYAPKCLKYDPQVVGVTPNIGVLSVVLR